MINSDIYQRCKDCGNAVFTEKEVFIFKENIRPIAKEDIKTAICCIKCGKIFCEK